MDISIVIPLFNEDESLPELCEQIVRTMRKERFSYEIIFVDDGSTDNSWKTIEILRKKYFEAKSDNSQSQINEYQIKGIRFQKNYGKSAALRSAFQRTKGDIVVTMDADLQDNPAEIPELFRMIKEEKYHLVSGWRKVRYDPIIKRLSSKLFNYVARTFSNIELHDFNCGMKAYDQVIVKNIKIYNDTHRWIPYLAKNAGFDKIVEKVVRHQARKYGYTKFGLNRFTNGYLDLFTLWFLFKFGKTPMRFFGLIGSMMFIVGFISILVIGGMKYYALVKGITSPLIASTPYFHIAIASMVIGTQLFLTGFTSELIIRNSQTPKN